MESTVLQAKFALAIVCTIAGVFLFALPQSRRLSDRDFARWAIALQLASRLGLFLLLFVALHVKFSSDVSAFYIPEGQRVLHGQVPYRDFVSSYGPAFDYLIAGILWVWDSFRAVILVAIALEAAALSLWLRFGFSTHGSAVTRVAAILYVCGPVPLIMSGFAGQNQLWMALGLAAASCLVARRDFMSGLWMGFTGIAVKLLAVLFVPPLLLFSKRPLQLFWAFAAMMLIGYGGIRLLGGDPFTPLREQAERISSGNLPFLATGLGIRESPPMKGTYLSLLAAAYAWIFWRGWTHGVRRDLARLAPTIALMLMAFMLLSRKSYTNYLAIFYFPMCLCFAASNRLTWRSICLFGLGGTIAAVEPSAWFRWLLARDLTPLYSHGTGLSRSSFVAFLCLELVLVACYCTMAALAWKQVFAPMPAHRDSAEQELRNAADGVQYRV